MEKILQNQIFEAVLGYKICQLARKYGDDLLFKTWEEIKTAKGDLAYFSVCGWKSKMTIREALDCLDDYCDFIEAMIRKHLEKEKSEIQCTPALFN